MNSSKATELFLRIFWCNVTAVIKSNINYFGRVSKLNCNKLRLKIKYPVNCCLRRIYVYQFSCIINLVWNLHKSAICSLLYSSGFVPDLLQLPNISESAPIFLLETWLIPNSCSGHRDNCNCHGAKIRQR